MADSKLLCTARDEAQAGMVAELLEQAHIPYTLRRGGVGTAALNSASLFGVELHVPAAAFVQAKELLDSCFLPADELDPQL